VELTELGRGGPQVSRVGLGLAAGRCTGSLGNTGSLAKTVTLMGMSGIYGPGDETESIATIRTARRA
jgi:hypothetical protein